MLVSICTEFDHPSESCNRKKSVVKHWVPKKKDEVFEANHSAKAVDVISKKDEDIIGSTVKMATLEVETANKFQVLSDEANFR